MKLRRAATIPTARRFRSRRPGLERGATMPPSMKLPRGRWALPEAPHSAPRGRDGSGADGRGRTRATPACPASTSTAVREPGLRGRDRCLDVSADLGCAGAAAAETSGAGGRGGDGHDLRHLTIPVEDDDGLSTGRAANELARPVAELANPDALHDCHCGYKIWLCQPMRKQAVEEGRNPASMSRSFCQSRAVRGSHFQVRVTGRTSEDGRG